jgi:hypothetical protein
MSTKTIQGAPCARGHAGLRYLKASGKPGNCIECIRAITKAWTNDNRSRRNAGRRIWRAANRETLNAKLRNWHTVNPDKSRAWDMAHPDRRRAISRNWKTAHPEQRAIDGGRRRGRQRNQTCGCCAPWSFKFIYAQGRSLGMHVDHVKPLAKGGLHCLKNMQLLSPLDNQRKSARYVEAQPEVP